METRYLENLPFPPSLNNAWKHRIVGQKAMVYMSERGREFRAKMIALIPVEGTPITTRVKVRIELFAPNKRTYDIDNMVKAVHDALTHAGVWVDDEQVDELTVIRGGIVKGGSMRVEITEL